MRRYDFAGYDSFGQLRAVLDVKKRLGTDSSWAMHLRDGQLERGTLPASPAFLLVVPDRAYVWPADAPSGTAPGELELGPVLAPYYERLGTTPQTIFPDVFEALVTWWLNDIESKGLPAPSSAWPSALSHLQWQHEAAA